MLVDDVWNEEAAMSAKVYDHRMSLTDMGVFRTGGYEDVDYGATSSTEYFQNGIWTAGPKLPGGLYKHCQVTIGSTVYVAGIKIMRNLTKIFEFFKEATLTETFLTHTFLFLKIKMGVG